jgi:hypothetical protein
VIAVVSATAMTATLQFANLRKQVDADRNRTQAHWLARSGVELAADRLLTNPDGYSGETASPIPGGEIKITVRKNMKKENVYEVESEGRFRESKKVVVITDRRSLKVQKSDKGARVEVVADDP